MESVIREMTRVANAHQAINLAQGFPDFPAPDAIKKAAIRAIEQDVNQYAITWGAPNLRRALQNYMAQRRGVEIDADSQVTVCCGATEAMMAAMLGVLNPGDEILIPEPFYENYGPDGILSGAVPRFVPLDPGYRLNMEAFEAALTSRTQGIVLNTPHNPTGRVFDREEMQALCDFVLKHDLLLFTDEIYEEILYTGPHQTPLGMPNMADRTLLISGASKTYSVTGWRVGWVISPPHLTSGVRKVHDFLTVGAPAPLQEAVAEALLWQDAYYEQIRAEYQERRDLMVRALNEAGFQCEVPEGAYYVMANYERFQQPGESDVDFSMRLVREAKVATVPGSSFYQKPEDAGTTIRFCYAKKLQTLQSAARQLLQWSQKGADSATV